MEKKQPFWHWDKENTDHCKRQQEFHKRMQELHKFRHDHDELHRKLHQQHDELRRYFRYSRYIRPGGFLLNLIILYILFQWAGTKTIGILFAILIIIKEILQFLFLRRLEKRILKPIDKLRRGVEEIAEGNYNVQVEYDVRNDVGRLVSSFNEMARKLSESEKIKLEYEENRKMLVASISHDLKTPITSIQGYIEAMLDGTVNREENLEKYLEIISRNTAYMNKLIDDLFLFSKLDMQKLDFQFEKVNIRAYMNDLMEEFKFELEEKQFRFYYEDKTGKDCYVNIDRKRIHQAIRNIIANAVKYGPEKDLSIRVEMHGQEDFVYIDIKDNGPGIPADKLPHIFNRFYRIDSERTKDLMSTGLGLAIAKELAEAHGGGITVTSREGEGSCFSIAIPMIESFDEGVQG